MAANRKRGRPTAGSGVLFEVRTALAMEQQEMADFLGYTSGNSVSRHELAGKAPRGRNVRHLLLVLAKRVSTAQRSVNLQNWMKETALDLEKNPVGGVFL